MVLRTRGTYGYEQLVRHAGALFATEPIEGPGLPPASFQVVPVRRGSVQDYGQGLFCKPTVRFWQRLLDGHSFPSLQTLRIDHQPIVDEEYSIRHLEIKEPILIESTHVEGLKRLVLLSISNCTELNDSVLRAMTPCMGTNLTFLQLTDNPALTNEGRQVPHGFEAALWDPADVK